MEVFPILTLMVKSEHFCLGLAHPIVSEQLTHLQADPAARSSAMHFTHHP